MKNDKKNVNVIMLKMQTLIMNIIFFNVNNVVHDNNDVKMLMLNEKLKKGYAA